MTLRHLPIPPLSPRRRNLALAALLLIQAAYFFVFLPRPLQVAPWDNLRYEVPGWRLAQGRGLSMPFELAPDPTVREWVCSRHPRACDSADRSYPTALYPPGYSIFVAGVYSVAGRSLV